MRDHGDVLTIGQLARYVGVSTKTVRVYHNKGLLPEPERDSSGYRRYTAHDVVELIKIRTLAEAGVPLARIRELKAAPDEIFRGAIAQIDDDLGVRIRSLRQTQRRLRELAEGATRLLPAEVDHHLQGLAELGFSARWVAMERDLWILVFATHPETAPELFKDQADALTDPDLRQLYLDYDHAHDLDPRDPFLTDLARRIVQATRQRYGPGDLPGQATDISQLVQGAVNALSPAWQQLDSLIRHDLRLSDRAGSRSSP
ncbi:DNA-binding transcriptional MerR regulator [Kribbella sp. VKM Ac-2527]|uniref:DNA-binding transcriptional MerR regulator n=1 Tax=Kribbella caucasensis TaxID=2512215 RepID=A0A4V3C9E3_9ACTN|nr:DNA-binding transcriptional MerR regulator [Kribbella sp. VKM Ac-2527]